MSQKAAPNNLQVPHMTAVTDDQGLVSPQWDKFLRAVRDNVEALGTEKFMVLVNNQSSAANIDGLSFSYKSTSHVAVDFYVQRTTTGTGATELIEAGTFHLAYKPSSNTWVMTGGPSASGVTLTVTSSGQVQYTTTNITGTASISKMTFRARTMGAKNYQYSDLGRR